MSPALEADSLPLSYQESPFNLNEVSVVVVQLLSRV